MDTNGCYEKDDIKRILRRVDPDMQLSYPAFEYTCSLIDSVLDQVASHVIKSKLLHNDLLDIFNFILYDWLKPVCRAKILGTEQPQFLSPNITKTIMNDKKVTLGDDVAITLTVVVEYIIANVFTHAVARMKQKGRMRLTSDILEETIIDYDEFEFLFY